MNFWLSYDANNSPKTWAFVKSETGIAKANPALFSSPPGDGKGRREGEQGTQQALNTVLKFLLVIVAADSHSDGTSNKGLWLTT